jgi:tetratricopeptide (TPR) repeat protein
MLRAKDDLVEEYQRLLIANESLGSLKRAIDLVRLGLNDILQPAADKSLAERLRDGSTVAGKPLAKLIDEPLLDQLRMAGLDRKSSRRTQPRLRMLAAEASVSLAIVPAIQSITEAGLTDARCSLLLDCCVLLAHHAYFALLPRLRDAETRPERGGVLAALHHFANSLYDTTDRFSLLALYFDAMGQEERAMEARRAALAATPSDAHEFMTTLQSAWSSLIEQGLARDALELLLETYPRVPRRDLDELSDLIRATFTQVARPNGHPRSDAKPSVRRPAN